VDDAWTISELVEEVERRIAALPKPQNGQVRAVPDDRTVRYYGTIGLLDRPAAMRGRTALYGKKHVAQVVAIKRMQTMGKSLAEIQALWPTLDDATLSRMSGIELPGISKAKSARKDFWKAEPKAIAPARVEPSRPVPRAAGPAELRVELAPNISLSIELSSGHLTETLSISLADVAAIRAAAAPLIAELARRQLAVHAEEGDDV
jgi:DNA-binding transcriptional MerR regulator